MNEQVHDAPRGRLLVVKMSSLGDHFHALPAVHQLKEGLGVAVDWVTQPEYVELARCFSDVDRVIPFPRRGFWKGLPGYLRDVRRERYEYVVDLQGLLKSAVAARAARGGPCIGPSFSREGASVFYSAVAGPRNKERHAVEENLDIVRHFGLEVKEAVFRVRFPEAKRSEPSPRIALVPCSRWATKNWPLERFVEAARALAARAHASFFIVGGSADGAACEQIAEALGSAAVNTCGRTSLVELGSLLQEMDLAITVDSGPMHMAAALGVPVLALFGATDPKRTGPYGPKHRVLTVDGLDCRPCFSDACARHDLACLAGIPAAGVVGAAIEMLGTVRGR